MAFLFFFFFFHPTNKEDFRFLSSPRMIVPIQWAMSIEGETDVYRERESQQQLKGSHYRADKEL
jgi:hypothetical protein